MRRLSLLLALLYVLGLYLTACTPVRRGGGDDDDDDDDDSAPDDDDDDATDADAADATADPSWPAYPDTQYADCTADIEIDFEGDGSADAFGFEEYNADGYWVSVEYDTDDSGSVDWTNTATRGPGNHMLSQRIESDNDPSADSLTTYPHRTGRQRRRQHRLHR